MIFDFILKAIAVLAILSGGYAFFLLNVPIYHLYNKKMQDGTGFTTKDVKNVLVNIAVLAGMVAFIGVIFLSALLMSITYSIPIAVEIGKEVSGYLVTIVEPFSGVSSQQYIDNGTTIQPTQVPYESYAIPTPIVLVATPTLSPNAAPAYIVVTATPYAGADLNPSMHPTPTPYLDMTTQDGGGTP